MVLSLQCLSSSSQRNWCGEKKKAHLNLAGFEVVTDNLPSFGSVATIVGSAIISSDSHLHKLAGVPTACLALTNFSRFFIYVNWHGSNRPFHELIFFANENNLHPLHG